VKIVYGVYWVNASRNRGYSDFYDSQEEAYLALDQMHEGFSGRVERQEHWYAVDD
jgi:hypothetical protein